MNEIVPGATEGGLIALVVAVVVAGYNLVAYFIKKKKK